MLWAVSTSHFSLAESDLSVAYTLRIRNHAYHGSEIGQGGFVLRIKTRAALEAALVDESSGSPPGATILNENSIDRLGSQLVTDSCSKRSRMS